MTEALLELRGLTKRYGALLVTDDVDLSVRPGSIHAIIGPNGAGKTSLIHQISGIVRADAGHVLLDGRDITRLALHRRARLGLARGFQITSVLPEFSVLENVALAAQAKAGSPFRFIRPAARETALNQQAHACLARVGLEARQADPARRLSHGEKRQLELAIALAARPRVLLLDEPLAGAGPAETARLVALLDSLRRDCAIVLVEHDMDAVFALADTISVLAQGRVIASGVPAAIRADAAVRVAYLGEPGLMLEVTRLQSGYGETQVLFDVSLSVGAGEVVTLLGRNGMGKTTTIRTIMGLLPARGGSIAVDNQAILGWPSFRIARLGLGLVPEGRQVFPTLTVEENLVATARPGSWTTAAVFDLFPRLHERRAQMARLMSGGEQQMLAIGRALMTNPRLLILDEATEGLAPLVRAEIWACLARLKAERLAILLIDKTLDALMRFADRHVIIEKGVTMWSGSSAELAAASDVRERYLHL